MQRQIDKVTIGNLDIALRACDIKLELETIDMIIDIFELLLEKGDDTTLIDIYELKQTWNDKH